MKLIKDLQTFILNKEFGKERMSTSTVAIFSDALFSDANNNIYGRKALVTVIVYGYEYSA